MATLCNYVVLSEGSFDALRVAVAAALAQRGWKEVPSTTTGARHLRIWRASRGRLVVELSSSWDDAADALARALSKSCGTDVASCYFTDAGEWDAVSLFSKGRKVA